MTMRILLLRLSEWQTTKILSPVTACLVNEPPRSGVVLYRVWSSANAAMSILKLKQDIEDCYHAIILSIEPPLAGTIVVEEDVAIVSTELD